MQRQRKVNHVICTLLFHLMGLCTCEFAMPFIASISEVPYPPKEWNPWSVLRVQQVKADFAHDRCDSTGACSSHLYS